MKTNKENNVDEKDNSYYSKEGLLSRLKEIKNGANKQSFDSIISQESPESFIEKEERLKRFKLLGVPISESPLRQTTSPEYFGNEVKDTINEARAKRFEAMNIPTPINNVNFYTKLNNFVKDPKMAERIKEIQSGVFKKEFKKTIDEGKEIDFTSNVKKSGVILSICPPKYDSEGKLPKLEPIKLETFKPKITSDTEQYASLILGVDNDANVVKDRNKISNPYSKYNSSFEQSSKIKLSEFQNKFSKPVQNQFMEAMSDEIQQAIAMKKIKQYEKDFGTYFEKRQLLMLKKEEQKKTEEIQLEKATPVKSKFKLDFNKYFLLVKIFLIAKYNLLTQKCLSLKTAFISWFKSIPTRWENFKLSLIMSKQQRELLARLPEALAPKVEINNEPEVPQPFKVFNKKFATFNYNDMKSLNKRVMQIPE